MIFALRDGLTFCTSGNRTVFLDADSGRYFALATNMDSAFSRWAAGLPPIENDLSRLILLEGQGVLVSADGAGRLYRRLEPAIPPPEAELQFRDRRAGVRATAAAVVGRTIWAWRVRRWPLSRLLAALNPPIGSRTLRDRNAPEQELAVIARAFASADLILGRHDRCLERSLAFVAACRKQGVSSTLVIGVQTNPFAAHCWAQHGSFVLNEKPDRVRMFTPILVS